MTTEWKAIETVPRDERYVMLFFPNGYWLTNCKFAIGFWSTGSNAFFDDEAASHSMTAFGSHPTHWAECIGPHGERTGR